MLGLSSPLTACPFYSDYHLKVVGEAAAGLQDYFCSFLPNSLTFALQVDIDCGQRVVVYDQSSQDVASLSSDCFLTVLLGKLEKSFSSVHLLAGKVCGRLERTLYLAEHSQ